MCPCEPIMLFIPNFYSNTSITIFMHPLNIFASLCIIGSEAVLAEHWNSSCLDPLLSDGEISWKP